MRPRATPTIALLKLEKRIMRRLVAAGINGMTRSDLFRSLSRPINKKSFDAALAALKQRGFAADRKIDTGLPGRPSQVWFARKIERADV